jgi:hypothetical protein
MNLPETIQKSLGYPKIHKVDPNTQDVAEEYKSFGNGALAQAAIPSILCGIYKQMETEEGMSLLLESDSSNWLSAIFGEKKDDLVKRVAEYAAMATGLARVEMEHIADSAVGVIRSALTPTVIPAEVYAFVAKHTNETLLYLPAAVQLGALFHHDNIDDRTNKMEGPVSNFLHKIERHFNSNVNK